MLYVEHKPKGKPRVIARPRPLPATVDEAVTKIEPLPACEAKFRFMLARCIKTLRQRPYVEMQWSKVQAILTEYLKALEDAQTVAGSVHTFATTPEFREHSLPAEIKAVRQSIDTLRLVPKKKNSPSRDLRAELAVHVARILLEMCGQEPKLTKDGNWHTLSNLIYRAAPGWGKDTWAYCRRYHKHREIFRDSPRYDLLAGIDWGTAIKDFEAQQAAN
jgi:hypothetical protein